MIKLPTAALAFLSLSAAACTTPATEVLVRIDTDAPSSRTIHIRIEVARPTGDPAVREFDVGAGAAETPASFAILPPPNAPSDEPLTLRVFADVAATASAPAAEIRRSARFRFTPHTTTVLDIFLPLTCGAVVTGCQQGDPANCTLTAFCEEQGLTCGDNGHCDSVDVMTIHPDGGVITDGGSIGMDGSTADGGCAGCTAAPHATAMCVSGSCVRACVDGYADCNGAPADGCEASLGSASNCGSCGLMCSGATPVCQPGTTAGTWQCASGCSASQTLCGGACVDLQSDLANCGVCGTACAAANATSSCVAGRCVVSGCNSGYGDCNAMASDGCETSTVSSATNCGACGHDCGTGGGCVSGSCTCIGLATMCGGRCIDTQNDHDNCGACGNVCAFANGSGICMRGACVLTACNAGFGDCNSRSNDGCETNLGSDVNHCGSCSTACASVPAYGSATCSSSMCSVSCIAGFRFCAGRCIPMQTPCGTCTAPVLDGCDATDYDACGLCCPPDHWVSPPWPAAGGVCCHYTQHNDGSGTCID